MMAVAFLVSVALLLGVTHFLPIYLGESGDITRPIGLVTAFAGELFFIKENMNEVKETRIGQWTFYEGKIHGREVLAFFCGVGKVNAAAGTAVMIQSFQPRAIIFSGIAGGVPDFCEIGDMTISSRVVQHDYGRVIPIGEVPDGTYPETTDLVRGFMPGGVPIYKTGRDERVKFLEADDGLIELAWNASQEILFENIPGTDRIPTVRIGTIATGDQFIASTQKCEWLYDTFQAYATEMEGGAVAQIAYVYDIPWVIIRTHSDRADDVATEIVEEFWGYAAQTSARTTLKMIELWPIQAVS